MTESNRSWRVAEMPTEQLATSHFALETAEIPEVSDGEVLCRVLWISIDAAQRAWLQAATYRAAVKVGDTMPGFALAQVVESRSPDLEVGDIVSGDLLWQDYVVATPQNLRRIFPKRPLSNYLSVLGITGLTAYFGLLDVGQAKPGETIVVSGAAGATGSLVGQIAKLRGCRVVGICSSPEKQEWLTSELGFDAAVSHRDDSFRTALREACPDGVDVYFDNVGGTTLDTVLGSMAYRGRVVCCGVVSQYDTTSPSRGARGVPGVLIVKSITMRGFLYTDFADRFDAGLQSLEGWLEDGSLKVREDILEGLETAPEGLIGVLNGTNIGKRMIHVADPS
ncbi:NADP-dependent oxidoreductase [Mycobacterium paraintracellulare]|uniref:NADP-dependent oxidoreductase n=1 Tax=Mycobacterium paraintracellulare TaxID=1138383 RepID=UPI0019283C4E|nr:NADP-dependent oxidoreductase [Mycobacterium paraintracellulare]BCP14083.1 NADP-dependent oxidoreductase [Mycobacterium paraintracellulare]